MPTTFNVFSLGTGPFIDPTEGNDNAENAGALVGSTFGGPVSPLYANIQEFSPGSTGWSSGGTTGYDQNNFNANDTFRLDGGADQTVDGLSVYNATLTYADGTTATITAVVFQDTAGNLYLAPELGAGADQTALEAKAIESLTLNSISSTFSNGLTASREAGNYVTPDGIVDGTSGDDAIKAGYVDAQGDAVDGFDGNNDSISAGGGNDQISSGKGNDTVDGGDGNDNVEGGQGNDTLFGGTGDDNLGGDGQWLNPADYTSGPGITATNLTIVNSADGPIELWWIDQSNALQFYETIQPGETYLQPTFEDHNWILRDEDGYYLEVIEGASNQTVDYGAEGLNDSVDGGIGNDIVRGLLGDDTLAGGEGNDTVSGGYGSDLLDGGDGNDRAVFAGNHDDYTYDIIGPNQITVTHIPTGDVDTISAFEEIQFADGLFDLIIGTDGIDNLLHDGEGDGIARDFVIGGDGADTMNTGIGDDIFYGGAGNDSILPGPGADTVYAGAGDDVVWLSADDSVDGGSGIDTLDATFDAFAEDIVFTSATGGVVDNGTAFEDFEVFASGDGADFYDTRQATGDLSITTGADSDTVISGFGDDTINGETGDDVLLGSAGADSIIGGIGNDTIYGDSPTSDPLILLNFADGASLTATDESGNNHDGIYQNGAAAGGIGWKGTETGVVLDGTNDYVEIPDSPDFDLSEGTISLRFNADTLGTNTLISRDSSGFDGGGHFMVRVASDGSLYVRFQDTSTSHEISTATGLVSTTQWHHVAVTFGSDGLVLYLDGAEVGSNAYTGGISGNNEPFTLGASQAGSGDGVADNLSEFFDGTLDEFVVYDQQFGGADVAILETVGASSFGADAEGNDSLSGGDGSDFIVGAGGDDTLDGGISNDTLDGGTGSDLFLLNDGYGGDSITGGEDVGDTDVDVIDASAMTADGVDIFLSGSESGSITSSQGTANFVEIEQFVLTDQDDIFQGANSTDGILLDGLAGNDSLIGGSGDDTLSGGVGNDTLAGGNTGPTGDSLSGGTGDDVLTESFGTATLDGGEGSDRFEVGFGNSTIIGGETGSDVDTLSAAVSDDAFSVTFGGTGFGTYDDLTDGDGGTFSEIEAVEGSSGADSIDASLDTGGLSLYGQGGSDTIVGGSGNDLITGGLAPADGADSLSGGGGDDIILGDDGDDTIDGGTGNDFIEGALGNDSLTGGDGDDYFTYTARDGLDTISDFNTGNSGTLRDGDNSNNDFIDLSGYYDHLSELYADQTDDGILNQSNTTDTFGNTVNYSDNTQFDTDGTANNEGIIFTGATASTSFYTVENTGVVCFAAGTRILTPQGEVLIEQLRRGDLVVTRDNGAQAIVWIGSRHVSGPELERNPKLKPIWISHSVTGGDAPMVVSRQHGLLVRLDDSKETLVRAGHLARMRGGKARVMEGCRKVTYFHLMFEAHEILYANGGPAESFYPGPNAFCALPLAAREEVLSLFPGLYPSHPEDRYGDRVRPVACFRELPDRLTALAHVK